MELVKHEGDKDADAALNDLLNAHNGWKVWCKELLQALQGTRKGFVKFRQEIRSALFPYYPNNPGSSDGELIAVIDLLVREKLSRPSIRCAWCQSEFQGFEEWSFHVEHSAVCEMFRDSSVSRRRQA